MDVVDATPLPPSKLSDPRYGASRSFHFVSSEKHSRNAILKASEKNKCLLYFFRFFFWNWLESRTRKQAFLLVGGWPKSVSCQPQSNPHWMAEQIKNKRGEGGFAFPTSIISTFFSHSVRTPHARKHSSRRVSKETGHEGVRACVCVVRSFEDELFMMIHRDRCMRTVYAARVVRALICYWQGWKYFWGGRGWHALHARTLASQMMVNENDLGVCVSD